MTVHWCRPHRQALSARNAGQASQCAGPLPASTAATNAAATVNRPNGRGAGWRD